MVSIQYGFCFKTLPNKLAIPGVTRWAAATGLLSGQIWQ
jgi:hypothetical protein